MKIQEIKKGICPKCSCEIAPFDRAKLTHIPNSLFTEFWVLYNDNSNASFPVCKNCLPKIDMDFVKHLNDRQRYTWGLEIINTPLGIVDLAAQLKWFIETAIFLEVIKIANTKEELTI